MQGFFSLMTQNYEKIYNFQKKKNHVLKKNVPCSRFCPILNSSTKDAHSLLKYFKNYKKPFFEILTFKKSIAVTVRVYTGFNRGLYSVISLRHFGIAIAPLFHIWDVLGSPKCPRKRFLESTDVTTQFYQFHNYGLSSVMFLGKIGNTIYNLLDMIWVIKSDSKYISWSLPL